MFYTILLTGLNGYMARFPITTRNKLILVILVLLVAAFSCTAGLYPQERDWKSYRLGGLTVHFPEGYEQQAVYTMQRAKVHLDTLQTWYEFRPPRVEIILNPDWDVNYAHATIFPVRVEIPVHPALSKQLRPQDGFYLDRVLAHELTHAMQFSMSAGITKPLRKVFGEVIAPVGLQPDWALEGQAIITESVSGGGRLNSSFYHMLWETPAISGDTWRLDQLAVPGRVNPVTNRAYVGGGELLSMLWVDRFSKRDFSKWLREQAKWPGLAGIAFKRTFAGMSAGQQYERLRGVTRATIRSMLLDRENKGFVTGEPRLEMKRTGWRRALWTPEGDLLARELSYDRPTRIARTNAAIGGLLDCGPELGYTPDPGMTLYAEGYITSESRRDQKASKKEEVQLVYVDKKTGSIPIINSGPVRGWSPAWSKQAHKLAWVAPTDNGGLALKLADLVPDSSGALRATNIEEAISTRLGLLAHPAWSSNGKHLAFVADLGEGEKVYLWMLETGKLFRISIDNARCTWDPAFSPDNTLWVSADKDGMLDLFEIDIVKGEARRRTRVLTGAVEPAVAPDNRQVAYSHYTSDGFVLVVLDSSKMADNRVHFTIDKVDPVVFSEADTLFQEAPTGAFVPYKVKDHLLPRFWMPAGTVLYGDEVFAGAATYGRDPLGFMEWTALALAGVRTGKPDMLLSGVYHDYYADYSAFIRAYPDDATLYHPVQDTSSNAYWVYPTQPYPIRLEGGAAVDIPFYHDGGPWSRTTNVSVGWITRERFTQYRLVDGFKGERYHGIQLGLGYRAAYGANRDPVPRHLYYGRISAEQSLDPISKLNGDLVITQGRFNFPGPADGLVISLSGAMQVQSGDLDYSRALVRPRGYYSDDLSYQLEQGKLALAGVSVYSPLWFTDGGLWHGLLYLERIDVELFAETATGWGGGRSLSSWMNDDRISSLGGSLHFGGYAFMDAAVRFTAGVAYRTGFEDWAGFVGIGLPNVPGIVYDAWTRDQSPRSFGFDN